MVTVELGVAEGREDCVIVNKDELVRIPVNDLYELLVIRADGDIVQTLEGLACVVRLETREVVA